MKGLPDAKGISRMADNDKAILISFAAPLTDDQMRDLHERLHKWSCGALRAHFDVPADCNWPFCGCDAHATEVLETLQECGALKEHS